MATPGLRFAFLRCMYKKNGPLYLAVEVYAKREGKRPLNRKADALNRSVVPIIVLLAVRGAGAGTESHSGSDYAIQVWQVEQGLPDNTVTAIEQSPDGYLWIGTFNGLARFDGIRFEVFDARTPGLESEQILRLCVDRAGGMWVSMESGQ